MTEQAAGRPKRTALVVSGGGARGAYQVGVLRGLAELGLHGADPGAFDVLVGSSAGSINAAMLAAYADDPRGGLDVLEQLWSQIEPQHVFRTDLRSLGGIGARWVFDLSLGGALQRVAPKSLLDTSPLRTLLEEKIPFERVDANLASGALRALAIPATNLYTSNGVLFVHARPEVTMWRRRRWSIERTPIRAQHVLASCAIPIFFPSVEIQGRHFGDGCIRNTTPLSSAIHLGADRIVAVGVRAPGGLPEIPDPLRAAPPTIAQISGVLLDSVMLDAIEVDVEHSERVNTSVVACPTQDPQAPFRWIDVLWLSPSADIGKIASELSDRIPAVVRYLMRGLGSDDATVELASYLLFDATFCTRLIELGCRDVAAEREAIRAFFGGHQPGQARRSGAV